MSFVVPARSSCKREVGQPPADVTGILGPLDNGGGGAPHGVPSSASSGGSRAAAAAAAPGGNRYGGAQPNLLPPTIDLHLADGGPVAQIELDLVDQMERHDGLQRAGVEHHLQAGKVQDVPAPRHLQAGPDGEGDGRTEDGGDHAPDLQLRAVGDLDGVDGEPGTAVDSDDVEAVVAGHDGAQDAVAEVGQTQPNAPAGAGVFLGQDAVGGVQSERIGPPTDESAEGRYERSRVEVESGGGDGTATGQLEAGEGQPIKGGLDRAQFASK